MPNLHSNTTGHLASNVKMRPGLRCTQRRGLWVGEDGIISIHTEKCVGCMYCVAACPYKVRFMNPETKAADKCNFCKDSRLARGEEPACVTVQLMPLVFGDANDPSEVAIMLNTKNPYQDKTHLGTKPRVYRVPTKRGGFDYEQYLGDMAQYDPVT